MIVWTAVLALAVLFIVGRTYQAIGLRRDARRVPAPGRLVPVGADRLHALVLGHGTPAVVFESGIAASSLNWRVQQVRLAAATRTWAYDRAGYGWSPRSEGGSTAGVACVRLHGALLASGLEPPYILVAHSFGGYVAQLFAARWTGEVAGMVLVDSITDEDWMAPDRDQRRALAGGAAFARVGAALAAIGLVRLALRRLRGGSPGLGRSILRLFGATASGTVTRIVSEVTKMPPDLLPAVQAHWSRAGSFLTMARHFDALPASAAEVRRALEASARWTFPLVVLSATSSSPRQLEAQRALAARSALGRHVLVDCGHWVHLDRPDLVEGAVLELIDLSRGHAASGETKSSG